jgi:CheY-like chemotaxis protein
MIVDDDELILDILESSIKKIIKEIKVVPADSGQKALHFLETIHPNGVVTDYNMPGMDGLELISKIREFNPYIPIGMFTGSDDITPEIAKRYGASFFVQKGTGTIMDLSYKIINMVNPSPMMQNHGAVEAI